MFESVQTGSVVEAGFNSAVARAQTASRNDPITYPAARSHVIHVDGTLVYPGHLYPGRPRDVLVGYSASKDGDYVTPPSRRDPRHGQNGKATTDDILRQLPTTIAVSPPYKTPGPPPSPASCTSTPSLAPISPTPAYRPTIPGVLPTQYPSVYGGNYRPKTDPNVTRLVIVETVHDPTLETEVDPASFRRQ